MIRNGMLFRLKAQVLGADSNIYLYFIDWNFYNNNQGMNFFCCSLLTPIYHIQIYKNNQDQVQTSESGRKLLTFKQQQQVNIINQKNNLKILRMINNMSKVVQNCNFIFNNTLQAQKKLFKKISPIRQQEINGEQLSKILLNSFNWLSQNDSSGGEYIFRMIKKSNYQQLLKHFKGKADKWIDPNFQRVKFQNIRGQIIQIKWENMNIISKINKKQIQFIDKSIQPNDIVQSRQLGDCYFLSSVASLAKKPQRILRLFSSIQINPNGIFMARLMWKGILQEVVVDEYFPYIKNTQELFCCRSHINESQIYVMVLQKCWAKLWKSYQKIDGGFPHEALRCLSGALTKNYLIKEETFTNEKKIKFFMQVLEFNQKNFVMCTGTVRKGRVTIYDKDRTKIVIQIEPSHIYSIKDIFIEGEQNKIQIYNPWGHNIIQGTNNKISGSFLIKWNDFINNFNYLTVCKIYDNANYLYLQLKECKKDGFKFIQLIADNIDPMYYGITISQTDKKERYDLDNNPYICVTFIVLKECNQNQFEYVSMKTANKYCDHYLELNLTKGKYIIAIYFTEVIIKQNLTFSIYSEARFGFKEKIYDKKFQSIFLSRFLINYNSIENKPKITKYPILKSQKIWISFQMMIQGTIFGYYLLHVDHQSSTDARIQMSKLQFNEIGLQPLIEGSTFEVKARPGQQAILIIKTINFLEYQINDDKYYHQNKRHIHQNMIFGEYFNGQ